MQHLSWDALRARYPETEYIFLVPQIDMHIQHSVPIYRLDVGVVRIDPSDRALVYKVGAEKDDRGHWIDKLALQKPALDQLLTAAGGQSRGFIVQEIPGQLIRCEGVAAVKGPDGVFRTVSRTRDWVADVEREVVEAANASKGERKIAEAWLRERQFAASKTESKAIARAIRALLGLRSNYPRHELERKSFVVPRWVFDPPADNPEILQMLVANALGTSRQLYPGASDQLAIGAGSQPAEDTAQMQLEAGATPIEAAPTAAEGHLQLTGGEDPSEFLRAKVAAARAIPHLDNIVAKYGPAATDHGLGEQFARWVAERRRELTGDPPDEAFVPPADGAAPSAEDLRAREVDGLRTQINELLGQAKLSDEARTSMRSQVAGLVQRGNVNGLRDALLWLEQQVGEVSR